MWLDSADAGPFHRDAAPPRLRNPTSPEQIVPGQSNLLSRKGVMRNKTTTVKTTLISVRVNVEQMETIRKEARKANASISGFVRNRVFGEPL